MNERQYTLHERQNVPNVEQRAKSVLKTPFCMDIIYSLLRNFLSLPMAKRKLWSPKPFCKKFGYPETTLLYRPCRDGKTPQESQLSQSPPEQASQPRRQTRVETSRCSQSQCDHDHKTQVRPTQLATLEFLTHRNREREWRVTVVLSRWVSGWFVMQQ